MPREIFFWMVKVLTPRVEKEDTHWRRPVPVDVKLAASLHSLVLGSSYFLCSDQFGIGSSTLQEVVPVVIDAIIERALYLLDSTQYYDAMRRRQKT
ncbi:hypothetical protein R1sor_011188 [Riccia sorocarpa]|uniref:Uncharacterized protein n=1 Tax=Riccia sorocarpa TaxID=122646 RepID=A0ABD3I065_9MARC